MSVIRRLVVAAVAIAAAIAVSACGEDDFPNEDRAPTPIELSGNVTDREVVISPDEVGAGPVTVVAANQSRNEVALTFDGPTTASMEPIPPGGVGELKLNLEQGTYEVSGGEESDARAVKLTVGPERASSQNQLLLP